MKGCCVLVSGAKCCVAVLEVSHCIQTETQLKVLSLALVSAFLLLRLDGVVF